MFSSFTKIYMKDNCVNSLARIAYWISSLLGIAFGDNTFIAN